MHCLDRSIPRPTRQKSADLCISLAPAWWVVPSPLLIFVLTAFDDLLDGERVLLRSKGAPDDVRSSHRHPSRDSKVGKTMSVLNPFLSHVAGCASRSAAQGRRRGTEEECPPPTEAMSWRSQPDQLSPESPTSRPLHPSKVPTVRNPRERSISNHVGKMTEFPSYLNHYEVRRMLRVLGCLAARSFPPRFSLGGRYPLLARMSALVQFPGTRTVESF